MSRNDYVLVEQIKKNRYEVSNRDADTGAAGEIYVCRTLEEAFKKAAEIEAEDPFGGSEYGIRVKGVK